MWHYSVISDIVERETKKAKQLNLKPCNINDALTSFATKGNLRVVPFLGKYTPKEWERTDQTFFVDISGYGREYEPALTIWQFIETLKTLNPEHGIAIIGQGQFQVLVALYQHK